MRRLVEMTAAAIRPVRIVEQAVAARLGCGEMRLALQPIIELASVGMKLLLFDLVACRGKQRLGYCEAWGIEHRRPKQLREPRRIRLVSQPSGDHFDAAAIDLQRIEQGTERL